MSAAAAILLANTIQQNQQEEEAMTSYSASDLHEHWEFKIVRAFTAQLNQPVEFRKLIDEEARAGWQLVEKFDDSRVRFKRPSDAKSRDANLPRDVDPYRTRYGVNPATSPMFYVRMLLLISFLTAAVLVPVGAFALYMERSTVAGTPDAAKRMQNLSTDISQANEKILETRMRTMDLRLRALEAK